MPGLLLSCRSMSLELEKATDQIPVKLEFDANPFMSLGQAQLKAPCRLDLVHNLFKPADRHRLWILPHQA